MANRPEISLIIPCYNSAGFVETAIRSVLNQVGPTPEILVVDDGSTDRTAEVLEPYVLNGSINYLRQTNKGPAAARNLGIKASKGEYLCFLDADDAIYPNSLNDRLQVYKKFPHLGFVFTDSRKVVRKNGDEETFREHDLLETGFIEKTAKRYVRLREGDIYLLRREIFHELILYCFVWTGAVMTRRTVLDDVGCFNEALWIAEDHDLWLRICRKYETAFRAVRTATYVLHEEGITNDIPRYYGSAIKVRSQYLAPEHGLPKAYRNKLNKQIALYAFTIGYHHHATNSPLEARREFRRAIAHDPLRLKYCLYFLTTFLPGSATGRIRAWKRRLTTPHQCKDLSQ